MELECRSSRRSAAVFWIRKGERRWTWIFSEAIHELQRKLCQTYTIWPKGTQPKYVSFFKRAKNHPFQLWGWSTVHLRRCTSSLTLQRMMKLKGTSRSTQYTVTVAKQWQYVQKYLDINTEGHFYTSHPPQGDNGGPAWTDRRHNGSPHWLLHSQWDRDHLLPA